MILLFSNGFYRILNVFDTTFFDGKYFDSQGMQRLIYYIVNEKIDIVLIYDKTRINIYDDLFMEFMMLCHKHKILVMTSDIFV